MLKSCFVDSVVITITVRVRNLRAVIAINDIATFATIVISVVRQASN